MTSEFHDREEEWWNQIDDNERRLSYYEELDRLTVALHYSEREYVKAESVDMKQLWANQIRHDKFNLEQHKQKSTNQTTLVKYS